MALSILPALQSAVCSRSLDQPFEIAQIFIDSTRDRAAEA